MIKEIMFFLVFVAICFGLIVFFLDPGLKLCLSSTPDKYVFEERVEFLGKLTCMYKTLPEYELERCIIGFGKLTENSRDIEVNTCGREQNGK